MNFLNPLLPENCLISVVICPLRYDKSDLNLRFFAERSLANYVPYERTIRVDSKIFGVHSASAQNLSETLPNREWGIWKFRKDVHGYVTSGPVSSSNREAILQFFLHKCNEHRVINSYTNFRCDSWFRLRDRFDWEIISFVHRTLQNVNITLRVQKYHFGYFAGIILSTSRRNRTTGSERII